jgi:hypothetical protein
MSIGIVRWIFPVKSWLVGTDQKSSPDFNIQQVHYAIPLVAIKGSNPFSQQANMPIEIL